MSEIKLVFEPSVYLVGQQESVDSELDRFFKDNNIEGFTIDAPSSAEKMVEIAGRLCYLSYKTPRPGGNSKYIHHILETGHGSVVENTSWSFIFTGVSRSLTHELVRHRSGWNYSQLSQRFVDESDCEFVVPLELQKEVKLGLDSLNNKEIKDDYQTNQALTGRTWIRSVEEANNKYIMIVNYLFEKLLPVGKLLKDIPIEQRTELRKKARQAARSLLPNATETKIFVTANARALRNFFELRGSRHAEPEIRVLANKVFDIIVKTSPNLFGDYQKEVLDDGTFELITPYKKV